MSIRTTDTASAPEGKGISIIMPAYNTGLYLLEAVQSILDQNWSDLPFELIIVNDGSQDALTKRALASIKAQNNPHIIIHEFKHNQGQSAARNQALKMARYHYVLPVDADDMLNLDPQLTKRGGYIKRGIDALEKNPDIAFVYTQPMMFGTGPCYPSRPDPYDEKRQLGRGMVPVCGIYRRSEALAIGGYDASMRYVEDWAFWNDLLGQRAREGQGRKVLRFTELYYLYRRYDHGQNVNSTERDYARLFKRFFERSPEIYKENYPHVADENMVDFLVEDRKAVHVNSIGVPQSLCLKFRAAILHPSWLVHRLQFNAQKHLIMPEHPQEQGLATDLKHHTLE
jgi:glycosyltransferase involved in cell wall biosynthesis